MGYASGWAMSIAMMSAPSSASRMAWLRPWPWPAPVMKATLPATRPAMVWWFSLLDHRAGVDGQRHAGDVAGLVGGEEQDRVADVDRLHPGDVERVERLERRLRGFHRRVRVGGIEQAPHFLVLDHDRVHPGRVNAVDPAAVPGERVAGRAHDADDPVLGRVVMDRVRQALEPGD